VTRRLVRARGTLEAAASALAVLGPNATLERGYAIVRTAPDGIIVREPVPAGSQLSIRVARGEFPATADRGGES
jgi:exodeoxyribonuclease VII large subunit